MRKFGSIALALALTVTLTTACPPSDELLRDIMSSGPLDESTVAAGLKDALKVGAERAVDRTSITDGFWGNQIIRLVMPPEFEEVTNALRGIGFTSQVDNFELAMNRAAEAAAGEATEVFWTAVTQMSIADAFAILNGHETAATEYFQDRTTQELRSRFTPIVQTKMGQTGVYTTYKDITDLYNRIPFVTKPALDLDAYITDKTLSGMFTILGDEEKRIREDPAARTTELLRKVFAKQGA